MVSTCVHHTTSEERAVRHVHYRIEGAAEEFGEYSTMASSRMSAADQGKNCTCGCAAHHKLVMLSSQGIRCLSGSLHCLTEQPENTFEIFLHDFIARSDDGLHSEALNVGWWQSGSQIIAW